MLLPSRYLVLKKMQEMQEISIWRRYLIILLVNKINSGPEMYLCWYHYPVTVMV